MRALILAAGSGTRMGKYAAQRPKAMLPYCGKPLLQWQIEALQAAGISDIGIVTGYCADRIPQKGVTLFHNAHYAETNMVESLLCARDFIAGGAVVSYGDIIFHPALVRRVSESRADIGVSVDRDWRSYWELRYGTTECDLESLEIDAHQRIVSLGQTRTSSEGIAARYIGLNYFSAAAVAAAQVLRDKKVAANSAWKQSGKAALQGYMTDLIAELGEAGVVAEAIDSKAGWLEFDTEQDYETCVTHAATPRCNPRVLGQVNVDEGDLRAQMANIVRCDFAALELQGNAYREFLVARQARIAALWPGANGSYSDKVSFHAAWQNTEKTVERLLQSRPGDATAAGHQTPLAMLATVVHEIERGQAISERGKSLTHFLQKKFEATKRLAKAYDPSGKPVGATDSDPEPYALLAIVLLWLANQERNLGYLSSALKVNDVLLDLLVPQCTHMATYQQIVMMSVLLERCALEALYE